MTDEWVKSPFVIAAYNLDVTKTFEQEFSVASIESILFYCIAFCHWTLEMLSDNFLALVNSIIANEMPHTLRWYRTKSLAFQYGFDLIPDTDRYNNTGYTPQQIEASKVVKYAAVNETTIQGRRVLLIKIATLTGGRLDTLTSLQEGAFNAYMHEIKDAGVPFLVYNRLADLLRCEVDVYYDPLLLDGDGNRLDGQGSKPVEAAANNFLLNLPFNGEFSVAAFIDALQNAYGVSARNVFLKGMERKTGNNAWVSVANTFIPEAGYVRFDTNGLMINYIPHVPG